MRFGQIGIVVAAATLIALGTPFIVLAQFVPGRIFTVDISSFTCKDKLDSEYVLEIDPEAGTTQVFAYFFDCPGLRSMAMSPDGKHLRVAAGNWGAILEFDAQGNWEIVIDGSDGVFPAADHNSITYDRHGNFYLSNYYLLNEKVLKFPADGGPKEVLAYYNNNGVIVNGPNALAVGPAGELYIGDVNRLMLIGADGVVSVFDDSFGPQAWIHSILVDDFGYVHVKMSTWYRYALGDPGSRVLFATCTNGQGICGSTSLVHSPDRKTIYTQFSRGPFLEPLIIAVDPIDASYETVTIKGVRYFVVVPLRADVDGDGDIDSGDVEWIVACLDGPDSEVASSCGLSDLDADGDVDLFDVKYFMIGYSAFAESAE